MRKRALLLCAAAACGGNTRAVRPAAQVAAAPAPRPAPAAVVEEGGVVDYRPQAEGHTLLEVVAPQGARVDVREGQALVGRDVAPMTVKAEGDHWYEVDARLPSGEARSVKVQARDGQIASLRFATAEPAGPRAMSHVEFREFLRALDEQGGDEGKLSLLRSAAAHQWFSAAMAGVLIDHITYRQNKLLVVPVLKDRILDKENEFWLYQHFTYREDREKVQELLER